MKKLTRNEQPLIVSSVVILFSLLAALSFFFMSTTSRRELLVLEYDASRTLSALVERFAEDGGLPEGAVNERILGFGLYSPAGDPMFRSGSAPASLPVTADSGESVEFFGDRIEIVRPLGLGPEGMWSGAMGSMGSTRGSSRMGRMPLRPVRPGRTAFLSYASEDLGRRRALYAAARVLIPVTLLGGMALILFLYRRNVRYRARETAQRRFVELGEAARTLAHEIKNPLGVIRIQVGTLGRTLPAAYRANLGIIEEEVDRLALLSDRVGEFLRSGEGSPEPIELRRFLSDLVARLPARVTVTGPDSGDSGSAVSGWDGTDPGPAVLADPAMLRSVFENLIKNAWESMDGEWDAPDRHPGGQDVKPEPVRVLVSRNRGRAVVRVLDRGCGIRPEDLRRVFDPFFTTKTRGSGIGLAVVRRFLESMGGGIELVQREGGGTEAIVRLPELREPYLRRGTPTEDAAGTRTAE